MQLDMFAPAPPAQTVRERVNRREVKTRAFGRDGMIATYGDGWPDPFEVEVRGTPCVIGFSGGFCTHVINPPGSPFWSETGFRGFGLATADPAEIIDAIERYVDAPAKNGNGCGGKLGRWWPSYILKWQQSLAFELEMVRLHGSRAGIWDQWGPEAHEDHWHRHDMRLADAVEQMIEEGIDPNDVGKPAYFKGKWPKIERQAA